MTGAGGPQPGGPAPRYRRVSRQDHADPDVPSPAAAPGGDPAEEPAPRPAGDGDPAVTPAPCQDGDTTVTPALPVTETPMSPLPCARMGTPMSLLPSQ